MKKEIVAVKITADVDTSDALDYLGSFSDERGEYAVKHSDGGREYKWFNADNVENMEQARENYKRVMDCERGYWQPLGIRAVADIRTALTDIDGHWLHNHVSSGGLWGVESDSGADYLKEVASEQLAELKDVLLALGFSEKEIAAAYKDADYSAIE